MDVDEARRTAEVLGLQCGVPGQHYKAGARITSLQGGKPAVVKCMHGSNVVAESDDGEMLVLAYYEVGIKR